MKQPHLLLITCDELRRDALNCYGGTAVDTPWIDSIARAGARYDQAYTVSPWCLPARCAILTGLYPHKSGAYSNFRKCPLDQGRPNLFNQLKTAGYHTSLIGKCHFAPVPYDQTRADQTLPYDEFKDYYLRLGMDHLDLQDDKQVSVWFMDDYARDLQAQGLLEAYREKVWDKDSAKVFPFPGPADMHPDAWVGRKAVAHVRELDPDSPSFTWVSFSGPHYPFDAPEEYLARVDRDALPGMRIKPEELADPGRILHKSHYGGGNLDGCGSAPDHACGKYSDAYWEALQASYHANVALIDDQVGQLLQAFREKAGDDFLVIFTADHGEMLGHHGVWGKHNCAYDDVWKIPFLVETGRHVAPSHESIPVSDGHGTNGNPGDAPLASIEGCLDSARTVTLLDILPTCLHLAGAQEIPTDGRDLLKVYEHPHPPVFAEGEGFLAVTDGRYKYVRIQKPGEDYQELLDGMADPDETTNHLTDPAYAPVLADLRGLLVDHLLGSVLP